MAAAFQGTPRGRMLQKGEKLTPLSERLARLGLVHDWDFVLHLPLRYEDETRIDTIASLTDGKVCQIQGTVIASDVRIGRYMQLIAQVSDGTGQIQIRFLHFYPSQREKFKRGCKVRLYGQARVQLNGGLEIFHPKLKPYLEDTRDLPRTLTPVYPAGEGITQPWLRKRINRAMLDVDLVDIVPEEFTAPLNLPALETSIKSLHHPKPGADFEAYCTKTTPAWKRLKFDELLAQQITLRHGREIKNTVTAPALAGKVGGMRDTLLKNLPFALTGAQQRCLKQINDDIARATPMHRLVQGDVGCGKTIVAALSALQAVDSGAQAAIMAPTEILAEQHYKKLEPLLSPIDVRMTLLTGSLKPKEKAARQQAIAEGSFDVIVGTHALIQEAVHFANLGLAIVDEQHRFGVQQRLRLRTGSGDGRPVPHLLMLSATPIPRTLAMSYLADIDVSVIDELPPGRTPVVTSTVSLERIKEVKAAVRRAVTSGSQVYWVCPLIDESEKADLTAATNRAQELAEELTDCRTGLIHGAMSAEEKEAVMAQFSAHELDLLVATTVIEVGVDVPNASVMVIEHAERLGLSQLHQLRGRVGRGSIKSFCLLLYSPELSESGTERLRIIRSTTDGFEIAQEDLRLRGPGEFMGARQSGAPMLRFANIDTDQLLLKAAQSVAGKWLATDPEKALTHARRWFGGKTVFLQA